MGMSDGEKEAVTLGVSRDVRIDERGRDQRRTMRTVVDVMAHTFGSSIVVLDRTIVLTGISASVVSPEPVLNISVDCSRHDKAILESVLEMMEKEIDRSRLVIVEGEQAWKLDVDVTVLMDMGNLVETCFNGVRAALESLHLPDVICTRDKDGNITDIELDDNVTKVWPDARFPRLESLTKVGRYFVVDGLKEEEECSSLMIHVGMDGEDIVGMSKTGPGFLTPEDIDNMIDRIGKSERNVMVEREMLLDVFDSM